MGILEQIKEMRNQGVTDQEIVTKLQEQGISPREISDALDQSRIKQAVTSEEYAPSPSQGEYAPQPQETMPETQSTGYSQPQEYYQQDQYGYSGGGMDSNMMIEISEQVFSEKIKRIQKQVDETSEFKTLAETKIENISERLKRIELTIDKLQMAILNKIGSYGDNLNSIKKEMRMMQDSFGKIVNQAVRGHKNSTTRKASRKRSSKR